jgi:hypothetical protein
LPSAPSPAYNPTELKTPLNQLPSKTFGHTHARAGVACRRLKTHPQGELMANRTNKQGVKKGAAKKAAKTAAGKSAAKKSAAKRSAPPRVLKEPESPMPAQHVEKPGLEAELELKPRYEAPHYKGSGKLLDRAALVTGATAG